MRRVTMLLAALGLLAALASQAIAGAQPGQAAPSFFKSELFTNAPHTLDEYSGKVLFIFELGYS